MSKQAIIELLNSNALKYRKSHSRKAKSEHLKQLMELTGYKSTKSIIRYHSHIRKRKRVEKRGRLPKLQPNDIALIKTIWLKSGATFLTQRPKSGHRQNEKEIRQSTHSVRKSHGTNEKRGKEKKPGVSERITRPHRITGKYPKIPKKALQTHETREHFMSLPPPSG